uniref:Coiled-coil domain-containing protein 55 n=1 Tax=Magallana gigas TaxID=29159 RepID=K1PSC9_MAGGI
MGYEKKGDEKNESDTYLAKIYGLLIPKKKQSTFKASNVFGDDSDETQIEIDKALEADPTVYEYDNIYDDLKAKKEEKDAALQQKKDKKPKYIAGLLKAAEIRKKEDERRAEKKIQKEREKEGNEFEDKEVFVTGAYKKKMQEIQEQEEKERREAAMEGRVQNEYARFRAAFHLYCDVIFLLG